MIVEKNNIDTKSIIMNRVPDAVFYGEILTYLHLEDVFQFSGVSKNIRTKIINEYIGGFKKANKLIRNRCKQRKQQKQKFFYNFLYSLPSNLIYSSYTMARIFCYIDDQFHNTDFTKRILQWDKFYPTKQEYLTNEHKQFYKYCIEEIKYHYDNLRTIDLSIKS